MIEGQRAACPACPDALGQGALQEGYSLLRYRYEDGSQSASRDDELSLSLRFGHATRR